MRLLFFLFVLLNVSNAKGQETFQKNFGGNKFERALFLTHTSDGGYMTTGYSSSFSGNYDIHIVKLDDKANIEWQKSFGNDKTDIGWGVKELKDKSYLVLGAVGIDSTNDDIWIARLDKNGNKLWEKTYGSKVYERCTQMLSTSDGNFLLIGQRNVEPGKNIDSYILKIDIDGNLIWEKCFGGSFMERTFYGAETQGGDFIISGLILPYKNNKADIFLLKLNKNGEQLWTKTYGEEKVHDIVHSLSLNSDKKTYTMTGYSETIREGFHEALFMQIDENGNLLKKQTHDNGEDVRLMHSEQTKDGGFIVTGYTRKDITKNIYDAVLLKYDADGKVAWIKNFGLADKDDQGYWIVLNKDGGYTLTGYTHSLGINGDVWLIKTNASGELKN
jgi:hypothetical protein